MSLMCSEKHTAVVAPEQVFGDTEEDRSESPLPTFVLHKSTSLVALVPLSGGDDAPSLVVRRVGGGHVSVRGKKEAQRGERLRERLFFSSWKSTQGCEEGAHFISRETL